MSPPRSELRIIPIEGVPEIEAGDDLAALIFEAAGPTLIQEGDIVVVAHKVVSKSEGRVVEASDRIGAVVEESARILRRSGELVISETQHGLVCANAGVDASNVPENSIALLPLDPDLSARRLRARIEHLAGFHVAVVISDTFGRAWRLGQTNVAIGLAGLDPFTDYRGETDEYGRELTATLICTADEIAGAAELVMGKTSRVCAVIVRGAAPNLGRGSAREIVRPPSEDLFR
jgi:coenzyme F420-0:L-glutamate ligase / coenzyme F420-1:gamma-L-glutamate ligase